MRRFVLVILVGLCLSSGLKAQKTFGLFDTVMVNEVVAYGNLHKYQSGAKLETLPALQLRLVQEGGIDKVLSRLTPIYVKSDAGGLSTIHFRGTSPNHTSINFGGINVNSLTLGHTNLSNLPSFLFDKITLQYGSSATVNGSGAIAGALYLGSMDAWTNGFKVVVKTTAGSFGEYLLGTKIYTGNGKWESVTKVYGYQKKNNFPFLNPYTDDVENTDPVSDIQHGAALNNYGFLQEFNYRFSEKSRFKSMFWLQNNWYQVQPNMSSNYRFNGTEEIEDKSIRFWTEYVNKQKLINYRAGAGYVHDLQVFNHLETQQIGTDRFIGEIEALSDWKSGFGWKTGAKYEYINPNVHAYSDSVIDFEQRFDLYFSAYYQILRQLKITLNMRQAFVSGYSVPFTPSLGGEYVLTSDDYSVVKFTSALSKSYRVPTFNDRYWGTLGNPDLKPEDGNNLEAGVRYIRDKNHVYSEIGLNVFYMQIKNWIEWRNFGVEWRAKNVMEVVSKGIEFQLKSGFPIGVLSGEIVLNYTINPVVATKTEDENGITGRQVNYMPFQMGNGWFSLGGINWRIFTDSQLTGKRYTDDFGHVLPANFITNAGFSYSSKIQRYKIDFIFSVNNIFDVDYQNERYYAMPGRYVRLSLTYEFNKINN